MKHASKLDEMRGCKKVEAYSNLNLEKELDERRRYMKRFLSMLGTYLSSENYETAKAKVEKAFDKGYKRDFFTFDVHYEVSREKDLKKILRVVKYFYDRKCRLLDIGAYYQCTAGDETIQGDADFILRDPEYGVVAVKMKLSAPVYSERSSREERKVKNCGELIAMYLGLAGKYGESMRCAYWHLKSKDDTGRSLAERYEERPGKNIVMYSGGDLENARNMLKDAMALPVAQDCKSCRYREVCQVSSFQSCQSGGKVTEHASKKEKPVLTEAQQEVVAHKDGPMCVIAVPGAGKTFSLVQRVVNLIEKYQIEPEHILLVTFTKKAAAEIRARLQGMIPEGDAVIVETFHSLGYRILREHPEKLSGRINLAEKVDHYRLIEEALKVSPKIEAVSYDGMTEDFGLLSTLYKDFTFIQKHGVKAYEDEYGNKRDVKNILLAYENYAKLYVEGGYLEYDDQILLTNELFEEHPEILMEYQKQFQYVMADEFQDVSEDQAKMVYAIAAHQNLVVVGDDDQTIYSWRGGTNRFLLGFKEAWTGAKCIFMEDNFRSSDQIIAASNHLISNNEARYQKNIVPHLVSKAKPIYLKGFSSKGLITMVDRFMKKGGYRAGDIAIIARKNKDLLVAEKELSPTVKTQKPKVDILEDAVFQAYDDLFALYLTGFENIPFYRTLKLLGCDLAQEMGDHYCKNIYEDLVSFGQIKEIDLWNPDILEEYAKIKEQSSLNQAMYRILCSMKELMYSSDLKETIKKVFSLLFEETEHPVVDYLIEKIEERNLMTVDLLYAHMEAMYRYHEDAEVEYPEREDMVNLITAHKSKGREYPVVLIYGADQFDDNEEGRCLLYVAMTRAKSRLYMTEGFLKAPLFGDICEQVTLVNVGV